MKNITPEKIAEYVKSGICINEIARWLINCHINKHVPLNITDLSDTGTVADEMMAISECIEEGDYQDAINIAENGAINILQDEGFDV